MVKVTAAFVLCSHVNLERYPVLLFAIFANIKSTCDGRNMHTHIHVHTYTHTCTHRGEIVQNITILCPWMHLQSVGLKEN